MHDLTSILTRTPKTPNQRPRGGSSETVLEVVFIGLICVLFAYLRWGKLNTLVREDPAIWLFQLARTARGELPYRDFSWNYPPLAIFVFGWALRWFGSTFAAVQAAVDVVSLIIIFLSDALLRMFLPRALRLATLILLITIGATAQTFFTLFSLLTYSPSLLFGTLGLLTFLVGVIHYARNGGRGKLDTALIGLGSFISLLSKPEPALACACTLTVLGWLYRRVWFADVPVRRWIPNYVQLLALCVVPAALIYVWTARAVGTDNLRAGILGYGLATFACPWWPTGLGLFGALAALGQAVVIASLTSLPWKQEFSRQYGRHYTMLLWSAWPCVLLYLGYYAFLNRGTLSSAEPSLMKLKTVVPTLVWTSPVLLPVMWSAIAYCCYLGYRVLRGADTSRSSLELLLFLLGPVVMSSRSLFGTTLYPRTEVSAICYAPFILLGPVLLWRFLDQGASRSRAPAFVVLALVLGYAAIRVIGGYGMFLSDRDYETLATNAGNIRLRTDDGSAEIYRYVVASTSPSDSVLEIPYGGGINFASGRPGSAFTTEFEQLRMAPEFLQRDVALVSRLKPKVILADDRPNFGSFYGWEGNMNCSFPRLVLQPDTASGDASYVLPVVQYITEHYRVDRRIGTKLALVPR